MQRPAFLHAAFDLQEAQGLNADFLGRPTLLP